MARAGLGGGMGRLGARGRVSGGAAAGGAALLVGEANGFAADFTYATDAQRVAKKTAGAIVYSGTSFFTSSGTSSKWVYDINGTLVNIPVGTLPLDYDPVTHAARGLLCEPAATNLLTNSHDLSILTASSGTVTVNNQTGPDGALTADTFTENTSTSDHGCYGSFTVTANTDYTVSRYMKMGTRRYASLGWGDGTNGCYGVYDLQSGVVGSSAAIGTGTRNSASIQACPNGWYRCILSGKFPTGTTAYHTHQAATAATITPDGFGRQTFLGTSSTLFMGLVQIEAGTVATSVIPTLGAQVTRAVDSYNCTAVSIGNSGTAGSWWAEMFHNVVLAGTPRIIGTNAAASPLYYSAATTPGLLDTTGLTKTTTTIVGSTHKVAGAFASGDRAFTADGLAAATDAGATSGLLAPTTIYLGSGGSAPMNGYLRKVRYLPRRPTNAELATMTT